MIEFATLLIGLVIGPREVEMAVQGPVATIEVSLDLPTPPFCDSLTRLIAGR